VNIANLPIQFTPKYRKCVNIQKACWRCKYKDLNMGEEPCKSCMNPISANDESSRYNETNRK
jgi:hypothetical protein